MSVRSRYRPGAPPDYSHRRHAGNVGDVWKHCVLVAVLRRAADAAGGVAAYVDTHAGEASYPLGPTGEWTEGIGRLWSETRLGGDGALADYLTLCRRLARGGDRPETYPGSSLLADAVLGPEASMALWERDRETFERLKRSLAARSRRRCAHGDGLAALADELRLVADGAGVVALVDPPYSQKADWTVVPDAVAAAARAHPGASLLLWYPVKSLTRPNAMMARLRDAGVSGTTAELVTTPLEHRRNRLNGSGMILVRPPAGTLEAVAAAAPLVAERCATRRGAWSLRMVGW